MLAYFLCEYLEELNPMKKPALLFSDLWAATLHDVNYEEVADAFLEDLDP